MRLRLALALTLYGIGLAKLIDRFVFREMNSYLTGDPQALEAKYIGRFPGFLQPLFGSRPEPATIICVVLFTIAGLLLLGEEQLWPKFIALTSFILAFWNLFSLM